MLTTFLALGLASAQSPASADIVTPAERVITLSRASGFSTALQSVDPYDVVNFKIDMAALLEEGEAFSQVTLAVLPASATLGFSIPDSGTYGPVNIDDSHVVIWPQIDDAKQAAQSWSGQGTLCSFEISLLTDNQPPRKWQRTATIRVAQK